MAFPSHVGVEGDAWPAQFAAGGSFTGGAIEIDVPTRWLPQFAQSAALARTWTWLTAPPVGTC
ncbi:hypothetical protein R4282_13680 [Rhodococcus oxybenzonivorans]|uniref:hypothetical protein n=1 Tax=Rhodococcus oxybenzonivorans TaxID=1990687 RepID=UPI002952E58A|nr:hypothetical protein [Rhodococcus oxybenzonivorans]MDV7354057.1 hypothetical protein [Rhodococcus oxybenzonivorans]